jgi:hypothetical protein
MGVVGGGGGSGYANDPSFWEKPEIDRENPLHRKQSFEIAREYTGFLRKRPPFKILATPLLFPPNLKDHMMARPLYF